jgi:hypothetical protein
MAQTPTERRMSESERHEKIMNYVRKHPRCIKQNVLDYMTENGSSPVTAYKDLMILIKDGRISVLKDKPNSQIHYLVVNDGNKFNILEKAIKDLNAGPSYLKNVDIVKKHINEVGDYAVFEFIFRYLEICYVANEISKIEPREKRDALYLQITKVLRFSDE